MKRTRGFTLLEITIVLVVVSLIAAGIIAARSIIRTSQIQAIMGEYQAYASAVKNFKSKYRALPGDFAGATAVWGEVSASCKVGAATGTKTCNGDGDGHIEADSTPNYEHIAAWRHLGLSGFINQNFSGNTFSSTTCNIDIRGGDNVPSSKLKASSWNILSSNAGTIYTTGAAGDQYIPMNACKADPTILALWIGGSLQDDDGQSAGCARSQIPVFTAYEAYEIDTKYDDKRAMSGKIRSQYNNTAIYTPCEDTTSTSGGYRTSASGLNCSLVFLVDK